MTRKKWGILCLIALFIFSQWPFHQVQAAEHGSEFLTNVELRDSNGVPKNEFTYYDDIQVHYDFSIPNDVMVSAGDTMTIQLPNQLTLAGNVTFNVVDDQNNIIGQATTNKATNQVVITFTDYAATHENVQGSINIWTSWNKTVVEANETVNLEFPVDGGTTTLVIDVGDKMTISPDEKLLKWGDVDELDPTLIHWTVRVNYEGNPITNAVYTDVLGPNQTLVADSVQVTPGTYDENENWTPGGTLPNLVITPTDTGFKVNLGDLPSSAVITYQTRATDNGVSSQYQNTGILTGGNITEQTQTAYTPNSGGGGNGSGEQYVNVELFKLDASDPQKMLSGAEFELQNGTGTTLQTGLTTGADGKIILSKLALGDYQLVETKAPDGYILDPTPVTFSLKAVDVGKTIYLQKDNQAMLGQVELTKYDEADPSKALPGAEFKLVDSEGDVLLENLVTDANGQLSIDQLPFGEYALIETKAPAGYQLDGTPVAFVIDESNVSEMLLLTKGNVKLPNPPTMPETPLEPGQPEIPTTPTPPVAPSDPSMTLKVTSSPNGGGTSVEKTLPQTGDQSQQWPAWTGLSLLFIAGTYLLRRK
ncbi:LPXTG cell wall anchor domain-containing protein [Listeria costaricensis]|uniref:LPXTG cell wall anchor domain-containing protein n=1 Tax=Listeria costaricensis TaxID=2026604 RepID=UPI000C085CAF|nr:LPXTG cell wall anchor domain-containing protein [Listeria costaricensis]